MNYEELLKRIKLSDNDIVSVYMYGSRVYGNFRKTSDWDFIVIVKDGIEVPEQFSDNLINVNFYTLQSHLQRIITCEPSALECQSLSKEFIYKNYPIKKVPINLSSLRKSFSAKSSNSWVKAKKKLTVEKDYNDLVGKKSLWHALRIIEFGIQIATFGKIINFSSCNSFYDEIMWCKNWEEMFDNYKQKYNSILTEFRKVAPKN